MPKIYSYEKVQGEYTTFTLQDHQAIEDGRIVELCTLDGVTYVAVLDGMLLTDQAEEITASIQEVDLTPELREIIKFTSPQCIEIAERMEQKIREVYSMSAEQYFARIGIGVALGSYTFELGEQEQLLAFGAFVEDVREWGRTQRALLGL